MERIQYFTLLLVVVIVIFWAKAISAQHQEVPEKPAMWKGKAKIYYDTGALAKAFQEGTLQGHFRYFYMNTNNSKPLTDFFANGAGGGIRYETAPTHGFQFAVSGFFIFNVYSADLGVVDSITGLKNRYELGLFDLEDPENKRDLDRLEEFYLKYNLKESHLTFGRQLINTPYINLQDGRMRPTGVEGAWLQWNEWKNTELNVGYLYSISPRSTVEWYGIGESIGLYGQGLNAQGKPSGYINKIESKYILNLGVHHKFKYGNIHLWNFYVDRLFNTSSIQTDFNIPLAKNLNEPHLLLGIQAYYQVSDSKDDPNHQLYIDSDHKSHVASFKLGHDNKRRRFSINYTRISKSNRYLMPREWGRDPFYTFLSRERNEGYGDVHAWLGKYTYKVPKYHTSIATGAGYYKLPEIQNYRLNKYGMPSYYQFNLDLRHEFLGVFRGLEGQLLLVAKRAVDPIENQRAIFNKVNMFQTNVVLNYHF
ncbi:MAG: OprD family outer membrane porin [Bacteroidia bacterium]|nr:OprD family outer membrane porin [Bacteroidia bacterium]